MVKGKMIARVARAIARSQGSSDWWQYRQAARLAILALRDPAPEMLQSVLPGLPVWDDVTEDGNRMIDFAASEMPGATGQHR